MSRYSPNVSIKHTCRSFACISASASLLGFLIMDIITRQVIWYLKWFICRAWTGPHRIGQAILLIE